MYEGCTKDLPRINGKNIVILVFLGDVGRGEDVHLSVHAYLPKSQYVCVARRFDVIMPRVAF